MLSLHRFLIGLYGVSFVGTAVIMGAFLGASVIQGAAIDSLFGLKAGMVVLTVLLGYFLLRGSGLPEWMYTPRHVLHPLATLIALSLLAGVAAGIALFTYRYAGSDTAHQVLLAPALPAGLTVALAGSIGLLASFLAALGNRGAVELPPSEALIAPDPRWGADGGAATVLVGLMALATTVLGALALLTMLYVHDVLPEQSAFPLINDTLTDRILAYGALALAVVGTLPLRRLHGPTMQPSGLAGVVFKALLVTACVGPAFWFSGRIVGDLLPAPWDMIHAERLRVVGSGAALILILALLIASRAPRTVAPVKALRPAAPLATETAAPEPAPKALNSDRRGSKIKQGQTVTIKQIEVPDVGWLMKAYLITDWLLLRLFGGMLLFMAYMIHQTEDYDLYKVGGMLYGIAPQTVTYVYAAWGAMLLVPVVLPGFISRPRTVLGGAGKAAVLIGLALLILPGLDAAIDLYAGPEYRATLHASVPSLFKGVSGLAVFSAMAIALFRNLSSTPVVLDGMGKPAQRFSADELRALRAARMQG